MRTLRTMLLAALCSGGLVTAHAQTATFSVVHALKADQSEGNSVNPLVQATDGNFYGTAESGGNPSKTDPEGVLFQLTPAGVYTVLHTFDPNVDGQNPIYQVMQASDGNLYGTTTSGGNCGIVFKYNLSSSAYSVVEDFSAAENPIGCYVYSGVVEGPDGNLYGSLGDVGTPGDGGGIFQVALPAGTTSIYYKFGTANNENQASGSLQPLMFGSDGSIYGQFQDGGAHSGGFVFKLTSAKAFTILHAFNATTEGDTPEGPLVQGADGALYGEFEDFNGGTDGGIFRVTTDGVTFNVRQLSSATKEQGNVPNGGLMNGSDGNLWGVTQNSDNANGSGDLFVLTPSASLTYTAYQPPSTGGTYGGSWDGPVVQARDGSFYGAAQNGGGANGANNTGAIWKAAISTVTAAPVTMSFSPSTIEYGQTSTLTWSATAFKELPNPCYGFGSWTGGQASSGTLVVNPSAPGSYVYTLLCGGSESNTNTLTVNKQPSLTTDSGPSGNVEIGATVTIQASVTRTLSAGVDPTGSVAITFNGTTQNVALASGVASATFPTAGLAAGSYSYSTSYAGDANYLSSSSTTGSVTLVKDSTVAVVTFTPSAPTVGQNVTLTATVTKVDVTGTVTSGTVIFYTGPEGNVPISGSVAVANGKASSTASSNGIAPGTYPISAVYSGDASDLFAVSQTVNVVLGKSHPVVTLVGPSSVKEGNNATLTATVKRPAGSAGTPTGNVTFYVGTTVIATVTVNASGVGTLTAPTTGISPATYPVHAVYDGDASDATATSNTVNVTVTN